MTDEERYNRIDARFERLEERLDDLSGWRNEINIEHARRSSDFEYLKAELAKLRIDVSEGFKKQADTQTWLVRIVVGGVLAAFVTWIMKGGLAGV